jgi:PAS domain S-box-containing protein
MPRKPTTQQQLLSENEELRARLREAEETLDAIRSGEVDALVVSGAGGQQIFTLQGANDSYRMLVEDMNEGALTLTAEGEILFSNRRFAEMLKTPLERIIGTTIFTWVAENSQQIVQAILNKEGPEQRHEVMLVASDGEWVQCYFSMSNLLTYEMPDLFCVVVTDLRAQKRQQDTLIASEGRTRELLEVANQSREELLIVINKQRLSEAELDQHRYHLETLVDERTGELARSKNLAEAANLAKSTFLSSMSHELRTPLNAILGFAQLLDAGSPPPSDSQRTKLQHIIKAGWYLLELINEILDLAVIESGKMALSHEAVSLVKVIRECQVMIDPQAQKHHVQINYLPFDPTWFAYADHTRVKQVLINLLSNAVKYNRAYGSVEVQCTVTEERIHVSIKDTGEGLSADKVAHLFEAFNRLGQEAGAEQGTGIGLVVTRKLVQMMGGEIGVESKVGVGTTFWFELLRHLTPQPAAGTGNTKPTKFAPQARATTALRTLLYVEDNPASLTLVEKIIADHTPMRLLSAGDGSLGVALASAHLPDIILMDINLPGISGIEAMTILRQNPATKHIPIIALTANAMHDDIEIGLEAGFFRYLTKPIKINELLQSLDEALELVENRE